MPKCSTFPTLYDNCKIISISDLKRWEYLKPNQYKSGVITWSRHRNKTGSISIAVNTNAEPPYMELDYTCNKAPINYRVQLVTIPSNLGKGVIWFFICPRTGRRCRKLHCADTYFYHRSAFRGCFYEKQIQSHYYRKLEKQFGLLFGIDEVYKKIYAKHFKNQYNGKPTKLYLKLMKQVETYERNSDDLLRQYRDSKI
jgi:hypothetical protein